MEALSTNLPIPTHKSRKWGGGRKMRKVSFFLTRSQQGKKGRDKGVCTNSCVTLSNQLCMPLDGSSGGMVSSLLDGERAQWRFWSGHKPYLVFSRTSRYFELCPINISFFFWQEMSI
jgi:hypothetical protein